MSYIRMVAPQLDSTFIKNIKISNIFRSLFYMIFLKPYENFSKVFDIHAETTLIWFSVVFYPFHHTSVKFNWKLHFLLKNHFFRFQFFSHFGGIFSAQEVNIEKPEPYFCSPRKGGSNDIWLKVLSSNIKN